MSPAWRPLSPDAVAAAIADRLPAGIARVGVDGPPCAAPGDWAERVAAAVRPRPVVQVPAAGFWRDRSVRLEYGHEDVESYLNWLDAGALRREVLDAAASGSYLPSLRDPVTNRSTRAAPVPLAEGTVLIVSGSLLFGLGLPFDLSVHLLMSRPARERHTPDAEAWTLPAFDDYDTTVDPAALADVVVKVDDARHPAVLRL